MNRLVLIDGNAILHRAFHALPPLTAPDGSLVNAVYGFASILFKLFSDFKPTHMAVAFDRPKPTFRKTLYEGYQAKRPKMDEGLVGQIEKVHDLVHAFGIPIFEKDGFEADDLIGTLCHVATKKKTGKKGNPVDQVIIVTGDRDILQLVEDEKVLVFMPTKGLSEGRLYAEKDVMERMGVFPKLIPDLKGLMGDASDNYPGVAGIGPKTALALLNQAKSLKGIYRNLKDTKRQHTLLVSDAVLAKLKAGEASAMLSYDLATIRTDVPLDKDIVEVSTFDTPQVRQALETFHFHSLLKRMNTGGTEEKSEKSRKPSQRRPTNQAEKTGEQQQLF